VTLRDLRREKFAKSSYPRLVVTPNNADGQRREDEWRASDAWHFSVALCYAQQIPQFSLSNDRSVDDGLPKVWQAADGDVRAAGIDRGRLHPSWRLQMSMKSCYKTFSEVT